MRNKVISISVSSATGEALQIEPGELWNAGIGQRVIQAYIDVSPEGGGAGEGTIRVTNALAPILGVPAGVDMNIHRQEDMLKIGPLVGVVAGNYDKGRGSFGSQNSFFRGMMKAMRSLYGAGYIFSHPDIRWDKKMIYGYYLREDEGPWRRMGFPLPDVCYNRYFSDKSGSRSYRTAQLFAKYGIPTFNTLVGSKWTVHKLLSQDSRIAVHLPETRLLDSSQALTRMLTRHREVYIKPANGCKGVGIVRVSRNKSGYSVKFAADSSRFQYASVQEVLHKVQFRAISNMPIVQQSIRLQGNEPHFDFRVLVQKDRFNEWHVTGSAARIGSRGRITTNLHTGGQARDPQKVLTERGFPVDQVLSIRAEMEDLAVRIAGTLDRKARALGELGLDFVIDARGKVWFLEANPKPGRGSFTRIDPEVRKTAVSRPMEFASYLAGF